MPSGVDPDEFLLQNGAEAFNQILEGAADALSYKWKQLVRQFDAGDGDLTTQQKALKPILRCSPRRAAAARSMHFDGVLPSRE